MKNKEIENNLSDQVLTIKNYYEQNKSLREFQVWYDDACGLSSRQFKKTVNNKIKDLMSHNFSTISKNSAPQYKNNVTEDLEKIFDKIIKRFPECKITACLVSEVFPQSSHVIEDLEEIASGKCPTCKTEDSKKDAVKFIKQLKNFERSFDI